MKLFRRFGPGWWIRLAGLAVVDGIVIAVIPSLIEQGATIALVSIIVGAAGINFVFLSSRAMPLRWLVPGLVFLALLMVWPIIFTVFVALTNWSNGNFITKPQAIDRLTSSTVYLIETEESKIADMYLYRADALTDPDDPLADIRMLIVTEEGEGQTYLGVLRLRDDPLPEESPLVCCEEGQDLGSVVTDLELDPNGYPISFGLPGADGTAVFRRLNVAEANGLNNRVQIQDSSLIDEVVLDVFGRGQARINSFGALGPGSAVLAEQRFQYDAAQDVLIDSLTGGVCESDEGNFLCRDEAGALQRIDPGWREFVGFDNFADIVGNERIRGPFLRILVWNIAYASLAVLLQLAIGLSLALTFDDKRMKGRRIYRSLLLLPWAAPPFILILVWRGLLNPSFGPVNNQLEMRWLAEWTDALGGTGSAGAVVFAWIGVLALGAAAAVLLWGTWANLRRRRWFAMLFTALGGALTVWLVWKLLGPGFGYRDVQIPWVIPTGDWFWSKVAIILVTVWQGFPYFFLISTGALQAIPTELKEAARVDGASPFQTFWRVTFPLLMVGIAPLLIASFAFNFNAFVNIFLLTQGGPPVSGYDVPFGETDILISFVFDLAVESGRGGQYALAAAATFFIFFIVATISAIAFRFTKRLEEIYGSL